MSDESIQANDGDLVVCHDGRAHISFGNFSFSNVAAIYEPTDLSNNSSLVKRWTDAGCVFNLGIWVKREIEAGRVRIFDQRYQAAPAVKEEVITIGGKKYTIKEVRE